MEEKEAMSKQVEKLTAEVNKSSDEKSVLLKQVEEANEELCKTKITQEKAVSDISTAMDKKTQDEKVKQENQIKNLRKENTVLVEQVEKLTMQLGETKKTLEKEISDLKAGVEKEKNAAINKATEFEETKKTLEKEISDLKAEVEKGENAAISKATEFQNLIKENERLQLNLQATKKHNHIVLSENSRLQSDLPNTYDKVTQLKEDIQKLKEVCFQISQEIIHEFIQKVTPLKQMVEENVFLKIKAYQDCGSVVCANADIAKKVNALSLENNRLKCNRICYNRKRYPSSPADFPY